ncbi:MAG: methyltransferase domain-containing protein [Acidobacteriia bacterium]|nr:methyltransferase domain-containing protein [Terriglobia bacterium]
MQSAYDTDLAYIHHVGYSGYVRAATPGLLAILRHHGIDRGLVVDLGCGPGLWARQLTRRGYDALGIDISPAMIALARKTAPRAQFRPGSFLKMKLPPCVAVTAVGEVLNYTFDRDNKRREMARFFRRVHHALRPGGVFVFDLAGPERELGRVPRRWTVGDDWAILLEVSRAANLLTRRMTVFRRIGKTYRRSAEVHRLRLYAPHDILRDLRSAGFTARNIGGYGGSKFFRGLAGFVARRI